MPGTPSEIATLAASDSILDATAWADGSRITECEWADVFALREYLARIRDTREKRQRLSSQRRAMALLRSMLSATQRDSLARTGQVVFFAPSGNAYRLLPRIGRIERVLRHGRRWFAAWWYCLHDKQDDDAMPFADLSVTHMLMVLADESDFLANANANYCRSMLWNRDYLRRMRERKTTP